MPANMQSKMAHYLFFSPKITRTREQLNRYRDSVTRAVTVLCLP
jgi:hypothetical protein